MSLPDDVCRCSSNACPRGRECARRVDQIQGKEYWMTNFLPQDGSSCEDFIPMVVN